MMPKHPFLHDLALYPSGDLNMARKLRVAWHLRFCHTCRTEVDSFRRAGDSLMAGAEEMPPDLDWNPLAAEMKANIRLGVAAGEIVAPAPVPQRFSWQPAVAVAAIVVLVSITWWVKRPSRPIETFVGAGPVFGLKVESPRQASGEIILPGEVVLRATLGGIGVERNGAGLALAYTTAHAVTVSSDAEGSLKARYIDDDTGQVTIHRVYVE